MRATERLQHAVSLHQAGAFAEAEAAYRGVLVEHPGDPDALHLLGVLCGQTGRLDAAIELIEQAIATGSATPRYYCNLGKFLTDAGRLDAAVAALQTSLRLDAAYPEALTNLSAALVASGRFTEALEAAEGAIRLRPTFAAAHNNVGNACRGLARPDAAIAAYGRAVELDPDCAEAHNNLGNVLKDTGLVPEALAAYRAALRVRPGFREAQDNLLNTIHYDPAFDDRALAEEARGWYRQHAASLFDPALGHRNDPAPGRRLLVGYVSADFRDHPVGLNLLPLLREHDRAQVDVFCYSGLSAPDGVTERFRALAGHWRDVRGLSDERLADLVREDRIDILVDLSLHSAGNRLLLFARKPAPVQVTFAGYPGTTGVETIDYRITDPHLDAPGASLPGAEAPFALPETFWCLDPMADEIPCGPLPARERRYVTFGCLNNFCKVNAEGLTLWAGAMARVPSSRLLLLSPPGRHRDRTHETLQRAGIARQRVVFLDRRPRAQYLRLYDEIDIGLDTVPYNGHTTSLDAFWMGVPVVTLRGSTIVGRAGCSQSINLGLPELVARDREEFAAIAAGLAHDLARLETLRGGLRERMRGSALMDGRRFARHVEAAYRTMWQRWCVARTGTR